MIALGLLIVRKLLFFFLRSSYLSHVKLDHLHLNARYIRYDRIHAHVRLCRLYIIIVATMWRCPWAREDGADGELAPSWKNNMRV